MSTQQEAMTPQTAVRLGSGPAMRHNAAGAIGRHVWVLYVAPAVLVLVSVTIVPLFYLLYNSLTDYDLRRAYLGKTFIGLDNYRSMLQDGLFWDSVRVGLMATIGVVVVELTLGMALALLFNREFPGKRV